MERRSHLPGGAGALDDGAECPFCGSRETRLLSPFGGQLSVAQYWCRACRTGFDYVKWEDHAADGSRPG